MNDDNKITKDNNTRVNKFREWSLALAESFDAWRVTPRLLVGAYCYLVGLVVVKFLKFSTIPKVQCDSATLQVLLSQHIDLASASNVACRVVDTLGPPNSYTIIVSALLGVAAIVFGVYTNTGKDWSKSVAPWKWGSTKQDATDNTDPNNNDNNNV